VCICYAAKVSGLKAGLAFDKTSIVHLRTSAVDGSLVLFSAWTNSPLLSFVLTSLLWANQLR
jgi:hypothetical protein